MVVVCWNSEKVLGRCLEHLFAQDHANYEVIVVDDGSEDGTAAIAEAMSREGPLTLLRRPRNRGCPAARNLGIGHARGEVVAFIDDDGFAAPDWLRRVCAPFDVDETVGAVASTVFYEDDPLVLNGAGGTVNRQGWGADLVMNESYEVASIPAEALYPMGCGMAIRARALARVGGFDERMHNYYDDVDYGTRLWRAGFRVLVAPDAWIDHAAAAAITPRRKLLCERHRTRVVLKHAPTSSLGAWTRNELHGWRAAAWPLRLRKLRGLAWNLLHLPSVLAYRAAQRGVPAAPPRLQDDSWGDAYPAGVPPRPEPRAELAGATLEMADERAAAVLPYGWFPLEQVGGRGYRWAARRAAVTVRLEHPASRLRLDYTHVPVDVGGVDVHLRALRSGDPTLPVWGTRLEWQYTARTIENHPVRVEPGDYELVFSGVGAWSNPPADTREVTLALSGLSFTDLVDLPSDGLDMAAAGCGEQLVSGWFEPEHSNERSYRWAGATGRAIVRVRAATRAGRIVYRLPPGPAGELAVTLEPCEGSETAWSGRVAAESSDGWQEAQLDLQLEPGTYLLTVAVERTWSNPAGEDPGLWPEKRTLGFALSAFELTGIPPRLG